MSGAGDGGWTFMGLSLLSAPGVLVPRAETELLAETALRLLRAHAAANPGRDPTVVDMCCGSGNLACAIAANVPRARVYACDLTDACVGLARRNAEHLGLGDRVTVRQGDLFGALAGLSLQGHVDLVVCNPPYISSGRLGKDRAALLDNEPREAFDGGPFGIGIQQRVVREAPAFLRHEGWLAFEIGLGQERQMEALFTRAREYDSPEAVVNQERQIRVMAARRR